MEMYHDDPSCAGADRRDYTRDRDPSPRVLNSTSTISGWFAPSRLTAMAVAWAVMAGTRTSSLRANPASVERER